MLVERTNMVYVNTFALGDIISFTLKTGENIKAMAVQETPDGMLFITVDCLETEYPMFKHSNSVEFVYYNSYLRRMLNSEVLDNFPDEIKSRMIPMKIGNYDLYDVLRIPTEKELFGYNEFGENESKDVKQFYGMDNRRNRIAFRGSGKNTWEWYWLQNNDKEYASLFACVSGNGDAYGTDASRASGVRPVFLLS